MSEEQDHTSMHSTLQELKSINSVIDKISRVRETNHIMSIIINEAMRLTDANQGVINLVKRQSDEDMHTVIRKADPLTGDFPFKVHSQISGWVLRNKEMLRIDDLDTDNRFSGLSSGEGGRFKSVLCFPMIAGGEIIGLTSLVREAGRGIFDPEKSRIAGIIVSQSAQILKNALLYEELALKNQLLQVSRKQLQDENIRLKNELDRSFAFENIIGKSRPMKEVLTMVSKVCGNDAPVLILGATGTGKELIARAIHYNSGRKSRPLVIKNCGVKTETLLESELFGHIKGAFTGADRSKPGLFKEADGGTIFLDEIGDAPLSTQAAILRVIENGEIRAVGASKSETVNVRVLSATNKSLEDEIKKGTFRKDLFYRLNTFTIKIPPLGERRDDIPLLVQHFLDRLKVKLGRRSLSITPAAEKALYNFSWPGNVRQLENEIERAAVVCEDGEMIDIWDLSSDITSPDPGSNVKEGAAGTLKDMVEKLEKEMIESTLERTGNNIMKSSQILGLTRKGLKDKIKRYGISTDRDEMD
ncbi:MAG TPA: GAF domain-containing protein [candidate division Zixibacteria bacterium]|nr:GAF domain-containing protein [candidate division Zixibacteria bacterium]